jgi:peptidyl-prolyl cis-trans isomerase D
MLAAMRRGASGWVAKILFAVLIASFAVWGIGDIFTTRSSDIAVATVGSARVTLDEALEEMRREISELNRRFGGNFEPTEPIRRAIAEQVATRLAATHAVDAEAARMGLRVDDEALRQAIVSVPTFAGLDGRFSMPLFQNFLRTQGLTEPRFLQLLRVDLARQALVGAVRGGAAAPEALALPLLRASQERRVADLVEITAAAQPDPAPPEEAALVRWHQTNPEDFSAPEYRAVTVAAIGVPELAREIEVSEADISAAFEARRAEFEVAERRDLDQLLFPDEASASLLAAQWRLGGTWEMISTRAAEAGGSATRLGVVAKDGLPVAELADAAFNSPGGVIGPVRSPFGWHVLRVNRIEQGRAGTLEAAREKLREDIQKERAADLLYRRTGRVEDFLAGGGSLAEAAQQFGMALSSAPMVDRSGLDPAGAPVDLGRAAAAALEAAFAQAPGRPGRLTETPGGDFIAVQVNAVTPAALRPFADVRAAVLAAWTADQKSRTAEAAATALMTAAKAPGASLATAAASSGRLVRRTDPVPRPDPRTPAAGIPPEVATLLFSVAQGETSMVRTAQGFAAFQLVEIVGSTPDQDAIAAFRTRTAEAIGADLESSFVEALRVRSGATINPRALDMLARP